MEPKYTKGQKVRIIEVKNQDGNLKYDDLRQHINKTGVILDSYVIPMKSVSGLPEVKIEDYPKYTILLDDGITLEMVLEDALAALDG